MQSSLFSPLFCSLPAYVNFTFYIIFFLEETALVQPAPCADDDIKLLGKYLTKLAPISLLYK